MKKHIHLSILALYTLLALILTWPLAAHLNSRVPGEATWAFDESTFIWNMWWFKHSLLTLQQPPFESEYLFFPLGVRLTTYTFNLFQAAFGLPLQLGLSLSLANNLTLLFGYVISGYGMFLLVRYLLRETPSVTSIGLLASAFAAGTVYAFSASRMMYLALGHYNFVTIQWFPFYTLFLIKTLREPAPFKSAAMAGLFAALCLYAELTFSVFLIFLTLLVFLGEPRRKWIAIPWLALMTLITFGLTAPFVLTVLPDFLDPAYAQPGWGEALNLSADLVGLVTLTPLHPWSGLDWVTELRDVIEGNSRFTDANTLFLGYGILALAALGVAVRWRESRVWLWSVLLFTVLSLGPLLTINGQSRFNLDGIEVTFPMPFALLHYIPLINANRVPNRFGIPLTMSLAVLVGYGLVWLNRWLRPAFIAVAANVLLVGVLLFDQYSVPMSLTSAEIPSVYYDIGAEPDDFTIMQLPLGWRNSYGTLGAERTQLEHYQSVHTRPMLGGNTSRNPAFQFEYYANIPLFRAITEVELYRTVDDDTLARAREQAPDVMALYNVKYLIVHTPIPFRKPYEDTYAATRALTLDLIPHKAEPVYQSPEAEVFAVEQSPIPDSLTIDFGDWPADPYRGVGWSGNEIIFERAANWVTDQRAEIFFPVRGAGSRTLTLDIAPFGYPGARAQTVQLSVNDAPLDSFTLEGGWQLLSVTVPETQLRTGLNRLHLDFGYAVAPREVLPAQTTIGETGLPTPVDVELNSSADFAYMTVGFGDNAVDASTHRRGVNVAVLDATSGDVTSQLGFDTAANEFEAQALTDFINTIEPGQVVLVATQGADATAFFTDETHAAFELLGMREVTPPFSAIGIKGAAPGTAFQVTGDSAYLRLGGNPDTRTLAAAVDKVVVAK